MSSEFLYIGHRGTRTNVDENTIEAFKKAIEFGANYIELDVRKTKDNKLIILHDSSLDRTTTGSGLIKNLVWAEIRNFKTKIKCNNIPLLSEVLEKFKGKTKFMIELKEQNLKDDVFDLINTKGLLKECVFSGRKLYDLLGLKEKSVQVKTCYNITKGIELSLDEFLLLGKQKMLHYDIDMINLSSSLVTSDFIETCHSNKFLAIAWDFLQYKNPLDKIKDLIDNHIDGILFDNYRNISLIKKKLSTFS
ncbi:MAG: glycerophosphodiester phosphodiesterase [Promethearchaeota archaeon]